MPLSRASAASSMPAGPPPTTRSRRLGRAGRAPLGGQRAPPRAARPAADDQEPPVRPGGRPRRVHLVAGRRVHRAAERQPLDVAAADALVAPDAGPDLRGATVPCLA